MPNLPSDVVRACVVAGDVDTPYYRVGRGEPVLILIGDTSTLSTLLAKLPRDVRSVAPNPSGAPLSVVEFGLWLRGFLDALGLHCVTIIADSFFAAPALAFA